MAIASSAMTGGLCKCGCGTATRIAARTISVRGHVRGQPIPYLFRHELRTRPVDLRARFEAYVRRTAGCWDWTGARMANGYGVFNMPDRLGGGTRLAHRVSYELNVGPIPDGLELDHLCRVRHCVRPDHLEAVTHRENDLRGASPFLVAHREGRCLRGLHAMTPENARVTSNGRRRCRACDPATQRKRREVSRGN